MNIPDFENIKPVTIKSLRDAILNNNLTPDDAIFLHQYNYADIMIEHLNFYNESMSIPFYLLGILIAEDATHKVPEGKVGIRKNYIEIHEE